MMNDMYNPNKKKQTKKDKKKQKRQPVQPADSRGPQNNYYFQGAPSAARPMSRAEMLSGFNLPPAMPRPNSFNWE